MKGELKLYRTVGLVVGAIAFVGCDNVSDVDGSKADGGVTVVKARLSSLVPAQGCDDALARVKEKTLSDMEKAVNANLEESLKMLSPDAGCGRHYYGTGGTLTGAAGTTATANKAAAPTNSATAGGADQSSSSKATDYSTTNTQVVGVDEADFVKNDDGYIYIVADGRFQIIDAWPASQAHEIASVTIEGEPKKLYVQGNKAVIYSSLQSFTTTGATVSTKYMPSARSTSTSGSENECTYGYSCEFSGDGRALKITAYDISDRTKPVLVRETALNGSYLNSRRIGNIVHTVATFPEVSIAGISYQPQEIQSYLNTCYQYTNFPYNEEQLRAKYDALIAKNKELIDATSIWTFLPSVTDTRYINGDRVADNGLLSACGKFYIAQTGDGLSFLSLLSFDLSKNGPLSATTIIGKPGAVYASTEALYVAVRHYASTMRDWFYQDAKKDPEATTVHKFALSPDSTETVYVGSGVAKGRILNQFSMDEHEGNLRIATTTGHLPDPTAHNTLSVLSEKEGNLEVVGILDQIAPSEDIRSVRFNGDVGFIVTFKKTDPLFVLDLATPSQPTIKGELKIPGFSTYIHLMDKTHLLTIGYDADDQGSFAWFQGIQLQIMDVSDLGNPQLVHKEVIGTRGSTSEAATDHMAFNYFPERQLLAIPMTICEGGSGGMNGSVMSFSGLLVYKVTVNDGFIKLGGVPHKTPETATNTRGACNSWWTDSNTIVQRSIFMSSENENYVYSIAYDGIDVSDLKNLENPMAKVSLVTTVQSCNSLDVEACAQRSDCEYVNASPIDSVQKCVGEKEPVGCWPADYGCAAAMTVAIDSKGKCWSFSCLNVPQSMTDLFGSSNEKVTERCGVSTAVLARCE